MNEKYISEYKPLSGKNSPVILDTDIGPDCDDVGALAVLISYAKELGFPILGVCCCTSNKSGCGTVDAVSRYLSHPIEHIAIWEKDGFFDAPECRKYNDFIAENFPNVFRDTARSPEKSTEFYRKLLASANDGSVTVISIGMFNCLAALLDSAPDEISPLCGEELVAKKVRALVSMAAKLPSGREFNIVSDYVSAKRVLTDWPSKIYISDFNIGISFLTGFDEKSDSPEMQGDPIYKAYELYTNGRCSNCSFDLTAVQFAAEGEGDLYSLTEPGYLEFYEEEKGILDATRFVPSPCGNIRFMIKNVSDDTIAAALNERIRRRY